jgi:hypothetical protein
MTLFVSSSGEAHVGRHVERRRQVVDDGVSSGCTPLFLKAEPQSTGTKASASVPLRISLQRFLVGLLAFEVGSIARRPARRRPRSACSRHSSARSARSAGMSAYSQVAPRSSPFPDHGLHGDQVDDAGELALGADRQLDRHRVAPERSLIISTQLKKSAPILSILLTKHDARHLVLVGLAPHRLGLRLHAGTASNTRRRRRARAANAPPRW